VRSYKFDRRTLLLAGAVAGLPSFCTTPSLETFTDWVRADAKTREAGLQACLERIQESDASIHAWVQVLPQKATGNGRLSGIPFGAKDVFETKRLATEYGSPVYKGRIGASDATMFWVARSNWGLSSRYAAVKAPEVMTLISAPCEVLAQSSKLASSNPTVL